MGTALLCGSSVAAQNKVEAQITNVKNDKGVCRACLFANAASFRGETGEPFQCVAVRPAKGTAQASFTDIPDGTYALFVFHDENNNRKMDKNFLGIPKEGYGASNNQLPFASAPSFADNSFRVKGASLVKLNVRLRNL